LKPPRVLVFDSGLGGLSVARCIRQNLPGVALDYLADNAGFPYGDRDAGWLTGRCVSLVAEALLERPAELVVVACNTASTLVLEALRGVISVPVVGVVPAIKPAGLISRNRRIGVLATPATVGRPYLDRLIAQFAPDCQIERLGHPALVHWIEGWAAGKPLPEPELDETLSPFRLAGVDTVVLGCTHYPLIQSALQRLLPEVAHWVDSGDAIARRTRQLLVDAGYTDRGGRSRGLECVSFTGRSPIAIESFLQNLELPAAALRGGWYSAAPV